MIKGRSAIRAGLVLANGECWGKFLELLFLKKGN